MANQRAFGRMRMKMLSARALLVEGGETVRFPVRIADLSAAGAQLLAPRPLTAGAVLHLHLPAGRGEEALDLQARTIWAQEPVGSFWRAGLEFLALTERERLQIEYRARREENRTHEVLETLLRDVQRRPRPARVRLAPLSAALSSAPATQNDLAPRLIC